LFLCIQVGGAVTSYCRGYGPDADLLISIRKITFDWLPFFRLQLFAHKIALQKALHRSASPRNDKILGAAPGLLEITLDRLWLTQPTSHRSTDCPRQSASDPQAKLQPRMLPARTPVMTPE
jgi:hypothetical protein